MLLAGGSPLLRSITTWTENGRGVPEASGDAPSDSILEMLVRPFPIPLRSQLELGVEASMWNCSGPTDRKGLSLKLAPFIPILFIPASPLGGRGRIALTLVLR